ncbi:aminotransferase class I/II-fold pyridoxal phosphate-dependent enzyme [Gracilinema caldarium]|uniref:Aminotransferase class I and II n=1 Tax=Gracilinema caldarium (strain ATCC 51460 / DSM 7334 / H1) TaxID=744872 RepID=F8F3X4_GRAC1|nr:aminotransferase class I/II-fold pyridoxal phosphate-dependent enzyme [Gracilinema caldarium]AEJ20493.1 aminotransferase class I and II [Gracilinema caldarium DSM 7334]
MNTLATELNSQLEGTIAYRLLSNLGKRLYFPKGIIAQSGEAKKFAHKANATIGMAYDGGRPLILSTIAEGMPTLSAVEAVTYAPTAGVDTARQAWKDGIIKKNPSLAGASISLPVVVPGLTAGISYIADLFLDEGDEILVSDPCWDNYSLIFADRRGATVIETAFFKDGPGLDLEGIQKAVEKQAQKGSLRLILNFPNNPSGYSPTHAEAEALITMIKDIANAGTDVLVITDDAYFGLAYESDIYPESLFGRLAKLHEKVLAVKIDGPTKEDYVWGLRMGFVTFGSAGLNETHYDALIKKLMGTIRSSVSCSNTPAQYLMLKTINDSRSEEEKKRYKEILHKRYQIVKTLVQTHQHHPVLQALPFNSGYFMSFRCKGVSPETLRQTLLKDHGIGTIALGSQYLRIAFSSVEAEHISYVYETLFKVAEDLAQQR